MHCFYKTSKPIVLMLVHISTATNIRATLDLFNLIHGQLVMVVVIVIKKDKWKFKVRDQKLLSKTCTYFWYHKLIINSSQSQGWKNTS